eukprot:UN0002
MSKCVQLSTQFMPAATCFSLPIAQVLAATAYPWTQECQCHGYHGSVMSHLILLYRSSYLQIQLTSHRTLPTLSRPTALTATAPPQRGKPRSAHHGPRRLPNAAPCCLAPYIIRVASYMIHLQYLSLRSNALHCHATEP